MVDHASAHWACSVISELSYCGCGYPREALELVHSVLRWCRVPPWEREGEGLVELIPHNGARMIVLGIMDRARLLEHGSNIEWAWLTKDGERFLDILDSLEGGYEVVEEAGISCSECDGSSEALTRGT